jgi:ribonuclease E
MPKQIIIAEQHRIAAVFSEDLIQELIVATGSHQVGDIYLGIVENVLPGIDAAFVNIGDPQRNGFIHVTDLGPLRLKRNAGAITELLTPQQKVLIQVMKEPTGNKGPRLTGNITLPGRYLVLMPFGRGVNLSRRIRSENERSRLRALAILIKPAGMGLLVRTEAEGIAEEAIIEDLEVLQKQWEATQHKASSTRAPALLNRDDDFVQRVLRDVYSADVNRIVTDSHTGFKRVKHHLMNWNGGKLPQGVFIDHHREPPLILEYFRVNAAIREALKPRVDLPSGGYIIIERTEALTVIDVNSGSFTRSATARETVLWTNCEAATEIARQLRLRNIAGVIIIDFIDMDARRDQFQVLEHFNKVLKVDKARPQIAQLSELGLVELTRKRQGQNVYELFGRTCPTCGGLGHLVHLPGETANPEGEMVERYLTLRVQEYPTTVEPQAAPEFQKEGFDPELADALAEPALTNHPSYQEQGDIGTSRRRRRNRIGDVLPKNTTNLKSQEETLRFPSSRNTIKPEVSTSEEIDQVTNGKEKLDSPDRAKPSQQEGRSSLEPPEVISVEMTPEEQEVYALMGISPLVLSNKKVEKPKSVVVLVTPPGGSTAAPSLKSEPVIPFLEEPTQTSESQTGVSTNSTVVNPEFEPASETPASVEPEANESESSISAARRRRRRSSATETQLSLEAEN